MYNPYKIDLPVPKRYHKNSNPQTPINALKKQLVSSDSQDEYQAEHYQQNNRAEQKQYQQIDELNPQNTYTKTFNSCMSLHNQNQKLRRIIDQMSRQVQKQHRNTEQMMKQIKKANNQISHWQRGYFDITKNILQTQQKIVELQNQISQQKLNKTLVISQRNSNFIENNAYYSINHENIKYNTSKSIQKQAYKTYQTSRKQSSIQTPQAVTPVKTITLQQSGSKYKKIAPKPIWETQNIIPPLFSPNKKTPKSITKPEIRSFSFKNAQKPSDNQRQKIFTNRYSFLKNVGDRKSIRNMF